MQQSFTEEAIRSSPPPTDCASPPKAVDSVLTSKQTADSSTQTDSAPQQNPNISIMLQPYDAAPTLQTPNQAVPSRERIPLSSPLYFEPQHLATKMNNECQVCILVAVGGKMERPILMEGWK